MKISGFGKADQILNNIDPEDVGEAILFVVPQSAGDVFLSTALLPSIKELFPNKNIYFSTPSRFADILRGNKYIHKVLEYHKFLFDGYLALEGFANRPSIFSVVYTPTLITQKCPNYHHNGLRASNLKFNYAYN